jgi:hypothetical protein
MGLGADVGEMAREINAEALARLHVNARTMESFVGTGLERIRGFMQIHADPSTEAQS